MVDLTKKTKLEKGCSVNKIPEPKEEANASILLRLMRLSAAAVYFILKAGGRFSSL